MGNPLAPPSGGFAPLVSKLLQSLGATPSDATKARLTQWLDLMVTWNAKIDLTAARSAEELVDLMLADAVVLARYESPGAKIVDVGSGAGGPGLALAILRPDLRATLVEPLAKRVSFLRTVIGHLGAPPGETGAVRVVRGKVEEQSDLDAAFESAVARATFAPDAWMPIAERLVASGGAVWVLLARESPPEREGWAIEIDERYQWPLTGVERRALRYRRVAIAPPT